MAGIAQVAHAGGQVGRADKDAVHAVQRGHLACRRSRRQAFDLHHHADMLVHRFEIIRHRAVAVAALRHRHAANALRRVTRGGHCAPRIVSGFDKRDQEVVEACVQQALDFHCVVASGPHDRRTGAVFQRHQLRNERGHVVGRVFAVKQYPVESGHAQHFGGDGVGQRRPAADQLFAGPQITLEAVGKTLVRACLCHGISPVAAGRCAMAWLLTHKKRLLAQRPGGGSQTAFKHQTGLSRSSDGRKQL